jgi:hypothetical protein
VETPSNGRVVDGPDPVDPATPSEPGPGGFGIAPGLGENNDIRRAAISLPGTGTGTNAWEPALRAAETAVERLAAVVVDDLPDDALEGLLRRVRRPLLQLEGVRSRAAAASVARAVSKAGATPAGAVVRDRQRRLAEEHQVTHAEMQQQIAAGRAARDHHATGQAMADGRVAPRHAQLIAKVLAETPPEQRAAVEEELLELAARLEATAFGRAARELLGRVRPEALAKDEARQHRNRSLRATTTEDGGFAFSGLLYGAAAEQARVALNAFRRPDTPDEPRSPAQRGADAFEQLCAAALRVGAAPTNHGVRPHVMVVFTAEQFAALSNAPETTTGRFLGSGQTITGREVRDLVDDAEVFRLVLDAEGVPIEVSTSVRTVPVGLWRALLSRDGGCVWSGCDAPASWCDVAHGNRSYTKGGKLSLDNSLLLCRRHHRRFDKGSYRLRIDGRAVTIERVRSPVGGPTAAAPPGSRRPPPRPSGGDRASLSDDDRANLSDDDRANLPGQDSPVNASGADRQQPADRSLPADPDEPADRSVPSGQPRLPGIHDP